MLVWISVSGTGFVVALRVEGSAGQGGTATSATRRREAQLYAASRSARNAKVEAARLEFVNVS